MCTLLVPATSGGHTRRAPVLSLGCVNSFPPFLSFLSCKPGPKHTVNTVQTKNRGNEIPEGVSRGKSNSLEH